MDRRERLIQAGLALSSELSLEAVLQRIIEIARDITGARYGALGVIGPDGRLLEFHTTGITPEERAAIGDPPVGHGLLGLLIKEARALRVSPISDHPQSVGFPPNHPKMTSLLGAPVVARGTVFGDIYLTDKDGGDPFTEEDQADVEILAAQAGVAIENARLYEASIQREHLLDAFRQIATAILSGAEPDEALQLVARSARDLAGADLSTIALPHLGEDRVLIKVAEGASAEQLRGATFPAEGSITGEVIRTGKAIVVANAAADERAFQPVVQLGHIGPALYVPLAQAGQVMGTLSVANLTGGRLFSDLDRRLLETFADQAAVALEYARAQDEIHRLAVLEDRERIAKELHDGVIQALFAVGMGLQGTALISADPEQAQRIESAVNEIDRVIRDLRNYIFGLRPGILADRQLDQALRSVAEEFQQRSGVLTVVEVDESVAAELASMAGDILQVTREALSNVGRHAQASTCRVSLHREGDLAVLEIDDDGRGFDPERVRRGDGLANLEKRAEALGGSAVVASSPAQGTTLQMRIPL